MPTLNGTAGLAGLGAISSNPLPAPYLLGSAVVTSGTSLVITVADVVGVGDSVLIYVSAGVASRAVSSVSDSAGNTGTLWDADANVNGPGTAGYTANFALPVNGTITINFSGAAAAHLASAWRFSGIALKNDTDPASNNTTSTGWTTNNTTGTMGSTPDYVMPLINYGADPGAITTPAGFTALTTVAGAALHQAVSYKLVYSTASVTCSGFSWVNNVARDAKAYTWRSLAVTSGALVGSGAIACDSFATQFATAALAGLGAIACDSFPAQFATAKLDGVGVIAGSAVQWWTTNPATLAGAGAINAPAVELELGTTTLAGVGAINVPAVELMLGTTTLAGTGAVSCNANPPCQFGSAECDGVGAINATAVEWMLGTTLLAGVGAINAPAVQRWTTNPATLAGAGAIACNANPPCQFGIAECDGVGTVAASAIEWMLATDVLVGVGAINEPAVELDIAMATLAGGGAISVSAVEWMLGTTELDGVGVVSGSAGQPFQLGAAECDGVGAIGVPAVERMLATTSLAGLGTIIIPVTWTGTATLAGIGAVNAPAIALVLGVSALAGAGSINVPAVYMAVGIAAPAGSSSVSLDIAHTPAAAASLGGSGAIGASGLAVAAGSAVLASGSLLGGTVIMLAEAGSDISGEGLGGADADVIIGRINPAFASQSPPPGPEIIPPWPDRQARRSPRWPDGSGRASSPGWPDRQAAVSPPWPDGSVTVKTPWPDEAA